MRTVSRRTDSRPRSFGAVHPVPTANGSPGGPRPCGVVLATAAAAGFLLAGCRTQPAHAPMSAASPPSASVSAPDLSRAELVQRLRGSRTRVVVVPSDGDDEALVVAHIRAWHAAGTRHVLPLDPARSDRVAGLFRLADVVDFAGDGPHTVLRDPEVANAVRRAHRRGRLLLPGVSGAAIRAVTGED